MANRKKGALLLQDGRLFRGELFGYIPPEGKIAEVVFNTAMCGYQEIITDPSYFKQFVCFTYPSIGNYGVNDEDNQSEKPYLEGIIVRHYHESPSNFRAKKSLEEFLLDFEIPGLAEVDTRALVRHIRDKGAQLGALFAWPDNQSEAEALAHYTEILKNAPPMEGADLTYPFTGEKANEFVENYLKKHQKNTKEMFKVAVLDFGIKYAILENLLEQNIYPVVYAGSKPIEKNPNFKFEDYDGFFFSNGPGDPSAVKIGIDNIKKLIATGKPCFGICLGHQLLALALGGKTYKLKFGHHGANQPVKANHRKQVIITSQNHGFAVNEKTASFIKDARAQEINPNDGTNEGFQLFSGNKKILSVQYHPEAAPGPHDAHIVFWEFAQMLKETRLSG